MSHPRRRKNWWRRKHWCKRCEAWVECSKTGAVSPHRIRQMPLFIFKVPKMDEETRAKLEEEVRRWVRDPNYISCGPPITVYRPTTPPWCNEQAFYPGLSRR